MGKSTNSEYTITLDDDPLVHRQISKMMGIKSLPFSSPESLLKNAQKYSPFGVFVDVQLESNQSGIDLVPKLRDFWSYIPIIVVTNNVLNDAVSEALASGADDFIKKPFSREELIARYQARRRQLTRLSMKDTAVFADIKINFHYRKIDGPKGVSYLSPIEINLIRCFLGTEETLVLRQDLKRACWGNLTVSDSSLDRHIAGLRRALNECSLIVQLESVYGKGYILTSQNIKSFAE